MGVRYCPGSLPARAMARDAEKQASWSDGEFPPTLLTPMPVGNNEEEIWNAYFSFFAEVVPLNTEFDSSWEKVTSKTCDCEFSDYPEGLGIETGSQGTINRLELSAFYI